jgi:hypothetical protein
MMALLEKAAGWLRRMTSADMRPLHCADKLDNPERLVHYIEQ